MTTQGRDSTEPRPECGSRTAVHLGLRASNQLVVAPVDLDELAKAVPAVARLVGLAQVLPPSLPESPAAAIHLRCTGA